MLPNGWLFFVVCAWAEVQGNEGCSLTLTYSPPTHGEEVQMVSAKKTPKQKQSPNQLLMNKFKKILAIAYEMHSTWFVLSRVTLSPK